MVTRSSVNYCTDTNSLENGLAFVEPSLAKQSFREECDINEIVRRFGVTGELPQGVVAPAYAEYDDVWDFQTAMNAVVHAQESFNAMPAATRDRFQNDPQKFLEFFADERNRAEGEKLGLVMPKPAPDPAPDPAPVPEPSTPST